MKWFVVFLTCLLVFNVAAVSMSLYASKYPKYRVISWQDDVVRLILTLGILAWLMAQKVGIFG